MAVVVNKDGSITVGIIKPVKVKEAPTPAKDPAKDPKKEDK